MSEEPEFQVYRGVGIVSTVREGFRLFQAIYRGTRYEDDTAADVKTWIDEQLGAEEEEPEPTRVQTFQELVDEVVEAYRGCSIILKTTANLYWSPCIPGALTSYAGIKRAIDDKITREQEEAAAEEVTIEVELVEAPALPFYAAWLTPMIEYIGALTENVLNYATIKLAPLRTGIESIVTLPVNLLDQLSEYLPSLFQKGRNKGAQISSDTLAEVLSGTEPWMKEIQDNLQAIQQSSVGALNDAINEGIETSDTENLEASVQAMESMKARILQVAIANFGLHAIMESGSLGQIEFMKDLDPMVISKFGLDEVVRRATLLPIEKAVMTPAEQAYNRLHPNLIPAASQLINMVVKEVIPLDRFKAEMLKLGFKESWSQAIWDAHYIPPNYTQITQALYRGVIDREQYETLKRLVDLDPRFDVIWDGLVEQVPPLSELVNERVKEVINQEAFTRYAGYYGLSREWCDRIWAAHFIPPTLGDLLTAWRRGEISTERLDELMVLVDLDPRFKAIFDTRRYVDPSISQARFMFETGAIQEPRVLEIALRNGFNPTDAADITNWITRFQERRFRTSYLLALATGTMYGAYTEEELIQEVTDAGYTTAVADWILKAAEVRNKTRLARAKAPAPRLLTLSNVKQAYLRDKIDEDQLRIELGVRNYPAGDVDILVSLLNEDKVTEEAGGRKISLSQAELLNALKFGEVTEDYVRIELTQRGMDQDEIDILLSTKRKQWGL